MDLFSHSPCASPALGFLCGLVIYRTIYHNIHGNCNWITRERAHSRLKERWLTCLAMSTCLFCRIQIMAICLSDLTESIINSFDCVGRKELLPLRRKAELQAEQRRTLGNWRAGSCRWRVNSHTRCSHGLCLYMCFAVEVSKPPLRYITLFKRPNSVLFFFPCGTDYIWLIMSKQEIEAHRICDMEINLIWFGFVHFYTPSRLSMHVVTRKHA